MYKKGWILCNTIPTSVRTWGNWIEDSVESDSVILLITGNPGITDFYKKMLRTLHELTNIPVWVVSQAGNEIPPASENMVMPSLKSNPDLYTLEGQVKHKEYFIRTYIPKSKKIYLIGHSIGGKINVELLKKNDIAERIKQTYLICPTLQYIADTPNGKIFRHFLRRISPVLIFLAWIFTFFPFKIRAAFVYLVVVLYSYSFTIESCCVSGLLKLFSHRVLKGVFFFANDEMTSVKELDHEVYDQYYYKINAYYGQRDRWAPLYQYEDLKKKHPQVKCEILEPSVQHSFVFTSSVLLANRLAEAIKKDHVDKTL